MDENTPIEEPKEPETISEPVTPTLETTAPQPPQDLFPRPDMLDYVLPPQPYKLKIVLLFVDFLAILACIYFFMIGGIIRDVVCNEIPLILRKDIYATAAFAWALVFVTLETLGLAQGLSIWLAMLTCFAVRASAIVWGWSLPKRGERGES